MDEIGFARLLEETQTGVPVFLCAKRRRGNVAQQHFLAGLTHEVFQRDRRVDLGRENATSRTIRGIPSPCAPPKRLPPCLLPLCPPFIAAVMQKAKIASLPTFMHVVTFQLIFRQLWRVPVVRALGLAGALRGDEGGDFQPAHEIRDEGIGIGMHDRQIERHFLFFSSAMSVMTCSAIGLVVGFGANP